MCMNQVSAELTGQKNDKYTNYRIVSVNNFVKQNCVFNVLRYIIQFQMVYFRF